jgi:hypothetical protein
MLGRGTVGLGRGTVATGSEGVVSTTVGSVGSVDGVVAGVGTDADGEAGTVVAVSEGMVVVVDGDDEVPAADPSPDESAVAGFEDVADGTRVVGVSFRSRTSSVGVRVGALASPGSAWYMNFWKMNAGSVPPATRYTPCTLVIEWDWPSGYPIHTAVVSRSLAPTNQASPYSSVVPVLPHAPPGSWAWVPDPRLTT